MDPITTSIIVIVGLALGALLNIVIVRLPRERRLIGWPRCTRCGRRLAAWQLLPLFGWLAQRGRGRCCGRPLHWIFPLVELGLALTLAVLYARYQLSVLFFYLACVSCVLIVTGAIDWLHRWIYTFFILTPALLAVLATLALPIHSFPNALLGALVAGFAFVLMFMLGRVLFPSNAVPFGLGDVYLGIFIGAAFGLTDLMPALFYGVLLAGAFAAVLVVRKRAGHPGVPQYISYGSFLCLGALGYLLLGPAFGS